MEETRRRGLSAAVLKNIAVITMTIDHVTAVLLKAYLKSQYITNLYTSQWYYWGRIIGRIAFVLYAFMLAEGAVKTHNRKGYAMRLLLLAVISIVPQSYATSGKWFNPNDLNIFFLLFLGLITIYGYDWLQKNIENTVLSVASRILLMAASSAIALICHIDYGMMGILLIMAFYIFRNDMPKKIVAVVLVMTVIYMINVVLGNGAVTWINNHKNNLLQAFINTDRIQVWGLLALPFIYFYNGEKGRQLPKLFYYLYYPVHMGILAVLKVLLFG